MPEIPSYQSRSAGPSTTANDPANPGIVGGGAIEQGFSNLGQGLLVLAVRNQQLRQAEQVTEAEKHLSDLVTETDTQWATLRQNQLTNPQDPRVMHEQFQQFVIDKAKAHTEELQGVWAQKYFQKRLPDVLHSRFQAVQKETYDQSERLAAFDYQDTLTKLADNTINDPSQQSVLEKEAFGYIRTHAQLGITKDPAKDWKDWQTNVAQQRGRSIVGADPEGFMTAEQSGMLKDYWTRHGLNMDHFSNDTNVGFSAHAHQQNTLQVAKAQETQKLDAQQIKDSYDAQENIFMARHLPHKDEQGNLVPPESTTVILADLKTKRSQAILGTSYPSVVRYYTSLKHQEDSNSGHKPTNDEYNGLLLEIASGKLRDPIAVLGATGARDFDIGSTNSALGYFHTERSRADTINQQRIHQGIETIKGRFALPGGAALDPADSIGRMNTVLTRYFLWVEDLKGKGQVGSADLIGTAQKLAETEYLNMADHVISIIPRTEATLVYKKPSEVQDALKAGTISQHQAASYLQEIDQFERLQQIGAGKKARVPGKDFQ